MGITAAQALIKTLIDLKVDTIFGYPGGAVLSFYEALNASGIKHVLVRQEQAAAHAASGYARSTGKVGVCLATSGPGATNLVTGIATAYMDSIPMVIFTGQVATGMVGTDAFQEVDITGITLPITKHNYLVKEAKDLPRIINEAFHIAGTGRSGPVLIDLPKDVMVREIETPGVQVTELRGYKPTLKGHKSQIKSLAALLAAAERPVVYAGGGVISSGAAEELLQLAEHAGIPVTTTLMGIGAFPENHPLALGMLGLHGAAYANFAVQEADLLLGMGVRFDDRVTGEIKKFAPQAKIVHLDIDPAEIGKNVEVNLPIVGDIRLILQELLTIVEKKQHLQWLEQIARWRKDYPLAFENEEGVVKPQQVLQLLGDLTEHRAIVTTDVGQHQMWTAQFYQFRYPRQFITSGGLGTMGYGFPAAIGAKMGQPDLPVILVTGDGSFQMHMAELGTAVEQNLPLKILIFNNSNLGMVRQLQHFYCEKRYSAVDFSGNPDFVNLAACYGAVGLRITKPSEIEPVLKEALGNDKLTIVDCTISRDEMVYPMVPNNKGLHEMILYKAEVEANG